MALEDYYCLDCGYALDLHLRGRHPVPPKWQYDDDPEDGS